MGLSNQVSQGLVNSSTRNFRSQSISKMPTTVYKCKITDQEVFTQYAQAELIDDLYYKVTGSMTQDEVIQVNTGQNRSEEAEEEDEEEEAMPPSSSLAKACRLQNVSANFLSEKKSANQKKYSKHLMEHMGKIDPGLKDELMAKGLKDALKTIIADNIAKDEFNYYSTEGDEYDNDGIIIPTLEYGDKVGDKVEMFVWKWAVYEDKY